MTKLEVILQHVDAQTRADVLAVLSYAKQERANSTCDCDECDVFDAITRLTAPASVEIDGVIFFAEADVTSKSKEEVALALFELAGQVSHKDSGVEIGIQFPMIVKGGLAGYFTRKRLIK